jgi:kanamycin nucleotidyltransferase
MAQRSRTSGDHNAVRVAIARTLVERLHSELGEHLLAAAVYGSVAHGAAGRHSDVEIVLVTDETVPYRDVQQFEDGILVEYTLISAERKLTAARRVEPKWGVQADQYRHHLVLWDPDGFFPRCHEAARTLPDEAFEEALAESWWLAYELRGKLLSALLAGDLARIHFGGWEFAQVTALRIALRERVPYESGRTLWRDAAARGHGIDVLVEALTAGGDHKRIEWAVEAVWAETGTWGAPTGLP